MFHALTPSSHSFSRAPFPFTPPLPDVNVSQLCLHPWLSPPSWVSSWVTSSTPVDYKTPKSISPAEISLLSTDVSTVDIPQVPRGHCIQI